MADAVVYVGRTIATHTPSDGRHEWEPFSREMLMQGAPLQRY